MIKSYQNFDLRIRGSAGAGYTVEATVSDGGSVPPQPLVLPHGEAFKLRLDGVLHQTTNEEDMRAVGRALFNALFPPRIAKLWASAKGGLGDGEGLRARLHIAPPELMALPWELVFEEEYIGLRLRFPIVRYLDLPDPPIPITVQPPLLVLVAVSQPKDLPPLDVDAELASIREALAQLSSQVEMDVFDPATSEELLDRLRKGCHVLHYIGHGTFEDGEGYLILEDADEESDWIPASLLGQTVADSNLRLVVLNACETSVTGTESAFNGIAHQLVRAGMPAVIAMQQTTADRSAIAFSREFYHALADGWSVDAAVQEGQRSIASTLGDAWDESVDWAIPTLYMRAPNGVILETRGKETTEMVEKKGPPRQVSHTTTFHGPVHGPVHTGSGDIQIDTLSYGAGEQNLAQLRADLIASLEAARYQIVTAVVDQLQAEQVQEVQQIAAALEQTQLAQQEMVQLLTNLRLALTEAQEKALLLAPAGSPTATDILDAPSLDVAHRLKLTLPIIPFLLNYEGEVQLGSKMNLEMAWEWLKRKLGR